MTRAGFDWSQRKGAAFGIRWPAISRMFPATIEALARKLEDTQWLTTAEIEAHQHAQLCTLAGHFAEKLPGFRAMLEQAGVPANELSSRDALRKLPLLSRRGLQQLQGVATEGLPPGHEPVQTVQTSGSTGEPVVVRKTILNSLMWRALTLRELFWHQPRFDRRYSIIRATNGSYQIAQDWGPPMSHLFATGPAQMIPITADIAQQVKWLREFRPHILLVYPNVLDAIEQMCRRDGVELPGLEMIFSVSETLSPRIREAAARTFGARISDNYSSQELGVIAMQCPDSGLYHTMDESVIVEVIGDDGHVCKPGEIGRVVITDLQNYATPLFRYDIGDYAEASVPCSCGRGLHTLKRVVGRERNLILMPDGTRHWPLVGFAKFREVAPVVQYQMVQDRRDSIEMRLVTERAPTAEEEEALRKVVREALGYPFEIRFSYFRSTIPRGPNGKFDEFVCLVQS
jgi:phenylacetate-CoA ligase